MQVGLPLVLIDGSSLVLGQIFKDKSCSDLARKEHGHIGWMPIQEKNGSVVMTEHVCVRTNGHVEWMPLKKYLENRSTIRKNGRGHLRYDRRMALRRDRLNGGFTHGYLP